MRKSMDITLATSSDDNARRRSRMLDDNATQPRPIRRSGCRTSTSSTTEPGSKSPARRFMPERKSVLPVGTHDRSHSRPRVQAPGDDIRLASRGDDAFDAAVCRSRGGAQLRTHAASAAAERHGPDRPRLVGSQLRDALAERGITVDGADVREEQQALSLGGDRHGHGDLVIVERGHRVGHVIAVDDRQQASLERGAEHGTKVAHRAGGTEITLRNEDLAYLNAHCRCQLPVQRHERGLAYRRRERHAQCAGRRIRAVVAPERGRERANEALVRIIRDAALACRARGGDRGPQRVDEPAERGGGARRRAFEGEQALTQPGGPGRHQEYLVARPLHNRDLIDQARDDVQREPVPARNRTRAEFDYQPGQETSSSAIDCGAHAPTGTLSAPPARHAYVVGRPACSMITTGPGFRRPRLRDHETGWPPGGY